MDRSIVTDNRLSDINSAKFKDLIALECTIDFAQEGELPK